MTSEVHVTIDGIEVSTRPGKTVLEAASEAGIYIPYLCYHPGMKPFAACRMCVVEVEGGRGYPASCTLPVQEGMKINTKSSGVEAVRHQIMEMLTAEHPHGCLTCHRIDLCGPQDICLRHVAVNDRCVTCPKNERCELKDTTRYIGVSTESSLDYKYRNLPIETGDPFYDRDYNLCIVCGRCVRACEELRGDNAITFTQRAGQALVGTSFGTSLLESGCEFCGACIDVCPVGALVESDNKWDKAVRVERSICPHCSVGCQLNLEINRFDKVIRVVPELSSPANRGQACFRGKFGLGYVNHKERLRHPLVRRDGVLQETSWDEALALVALKLADYRDEPFAILSAPDSTNEEHYLAQKFARVVMDTNNMDLSTGTRPELVDPLISSLGMAAATGTIWDLEHSRSMLVFNANITEEHNVVALPIKKALKDGATLVVIDPREVELTRYATHWLRPRPGTELLLLAGLLKAIVDGGLVNQDWIAQHCQGADELLKALEGLDLDEVSREIAVPQDKMQEAARAFASAGPSAIVYALDNLSSETGTGCVQGLTALALLTGNLGAPGTGLYPLRQATNEQGAWDMGCVPHLLPGYRSITDLTACHTLQQFWGTMLPTDQGLFMRDLLDPESDVALKAMLLIGDSMQHVQRSAADVRRLLEGLEFLVVHSTFMNEVAEHAHVVLPRVTSVEKEGTLTSLERRVQLVRPAITPSNSDARPESWFLCQLAGRMGAPGFDFDSLADVMDEIAAVVPQYLGISHARLAAEGRWVARPDPTNPAPTQVLYSSREYPGIQWPCLSPDHPGTPTLYSDGAYDLEGGRARMPVPRFKSATAGQDDTFPLWLVPGRVLLQPDRDMEVAKGRANRLVREELAELNRQQAQAMGIEEGDPVAIVSEALSMPARATLSDIMPSGMVGVTSLFGQLATELQASTHPNPMADAPHLAIVPARLEKGARG